MTSVELRRVSKVFSGMSTSGMTTVLDEVDLRVEDGELLVLLGPNGCGKSTLLRLIAGLERVTAGEILLGGQVVNDWPPRHRDLAMMFQSGVLYPHLTVEQNLRFGTRQDPQVLLGRIRDTAKLLGIASLLNRLPRQLSGGERQRVALGRALVRQPAAFLLDEPVANADASLRQELRVVFQRARQQFPGTMILVSHDHTEALALGHRIAVLGRGKIQQIGSAREVYDTPRNRFVAEFLGQSSMSFVDGDWHQEHGVSCIVTKFGRLTATESLRSRGSGRVTLGLRTEAVTVGRLGSTADSNWTGVIRWVERRESGSVVYVALRSSVDDDGRADDDGMVVARVLPPEVVSPGDQVRVEIDLNRTLWFDARTGSNLAVPR